MRPLLKVIFLAMGVASAATLLSADAKAQEAAAADVSADQAMAEGDFEAGEKLYKKSCRGCHGPTAKGLASYPTLRNFPSEYLVDKLERYRAGEKFGPNTPLMAPNAKKLSDDDITNIVHFIVTKFE